MSVINKMLKDLDERQHTDGVEQMAKVQLQYQSPIRASNRVTFVSLSLASLLVGAAGVVGYQYWQDSLDAKPTSSLQATSHSQVAIADNDKLQSSSSSETDELETTSIVEPKPVSNTDASNKSQTLFTEAVSTGSQASQEVAIDAPISQSSANQAASIESQSTSTTKLAVPVSKAAQSVASVSDSNQASLNTVVATPTKPTAKMAVKEVRLSPKELGQKSLKVAQRAEKQGRLEEAIAAYIKTLTLDASNHQTRKQLAALYYGRNQLEQASSILTQGLVLYPGYVEFSLLLSRVQQAAGAYLQAIQTLNDISDFGEFARQKWLQQTDLAQKVQDNLLAEQAYRNLVRAEPNQGRWWMGLAHALDSQKKYADAKAAYRFALSKSGLSSQAEDYIEKRLSQLGEH